MVNEYLVTLRRIYLNQSQHHCFNHVRDKYDITKCPIKEYEFLIRKVIWIFQIKNKIIEIVILKFEMYR